MLWIEGLEVTTTVVNTGDETLKLLNNPDGPSNPLGRGPDGRTGAAEEATAEVTRTTRETWREEGNPTISVG